MEKKILILSTEFCADKIVKGFEDFGYNVDFYVHRPKSHLFMLPDYLFPNNRFLMRIKEKWSAIFYAKLFSKFDDNYIIVLIIAPFLLPFQFLDSIKQKYSSAKLCCYFWDDVEVAKGSIERVFYFDKVFSYNKSDCDKYNFIMRPFFFSVERSIPVCKRTIDVLHVGSFSSQHLYRYKIVKNFERSNESLNNYIYFKAVNAIVSVLHYLKGDISFNDLFSFKYTRMKWDKMIDMLGKSKAVLDIPRDGQIGLTTIVLQALGTGTKIITTDEKIKEYPFYDPAMIKIVSHDDMNIDEKWLNNSRNSYKSIDSFRLKKFISDICDC